MWAACRRCWLLGLGYRCRSAQVIGRLMRYTGLAPTSLLIQWLLWTPLKPCQIGIFSLCVQRASRFLALALLSAGVFLAPLNLLCLLPVSFCDSCFSSSSDDALLCVATRIESSIAAVFGPISSWMRRLRHFAASLATGVRSTFRSLCLPFGRTRASALAESTAGQV
jgi:hypothetical protein